jgi:cell division protein ZapE
VVDPAIALVARLHRVAIALSRRVPLVSADEIVAALVPPPAFADVRFATYTPDPEQPSQARALAAARMFAASLKPLPSRRRLLRRSTDRLGGSGLYLDGGYGVGKTHLLASVWHEADGPKLFATFVELTHLVGALGFAESVERLGGYRLLCIDEFELDDPGDTVLISTLLTRLAARGVRIAATSNTLPDALGEGRFAAEDFLREIQTLAQRFDVVRIDGPDYRHRDVELVAPRYDVAALQALAAETTDTSYDHFVDLCRHLAEIHPSKYGALVDGVRLACLEDVRALTDQSVALRLVVLVDRLYDRDVAVALSGVGIDQLFGPDMLAGGYRKKYFRALSRLSALTSPRE